MDWLNDEDWRAQVMRAPEFIAYVDENFDIVFLNRDGVGVEGRSLLEYIDPDYHERLRATVDNAQTMGAPQFFESEAVGRETPRATYHNWVFAVPNERGARRLFCFISIDVTKTERVEAERDATQRLLGAMLSNAPDIFTVVDRDYRIRFISRTHSGVSPQSLIGVSVLDYARPDQVRMVRDAIDGVFATGTPAAYEMFIGFGADERLYSTRLGPIMHGSSVDRVTLVSTDITQARRIERERTQLVEQLHQLQKMDALGKLTGGIAHDFNNLLMIILSAVEMLDPAANDPEDVADAAQQIRDASQRAADLTRHLLAFARRQSLTPTKCDINRLVEEERTILTRTLGEQVKVEIDLDPSLWKCRIDTGQLQSALLNVAINARDAMTQETGTLHIRTQNVPVLDALHPSLPLGQWILLEVADDGAGMTAEVLERAIEPFFTTKGDGGTGLGLSTVYGFVKQSGGFVAIDSQAGRGTTVRIHFPRCVEDSDVALPRVEVEAMPKGERVLLVEDDPTVRRMIRRLIERLGYRVEEVSDGIEALELLERTPPQSARFDVVLTDVVLPRGVDGLKLKQRIAERWPDLPVALMSGYASETLTHASKLDPSVHVIPKPFSKERLAHELQTALLGS
ncbi:MAG: response regulator [Deltaproteobacteria bacterium]